MCWNIRVYMTVLHNLFVRFCSNLFNSIYTNENKYFKYIYYGCCCYCCCCNCQTRQVDSESLSVMEIPDPNVNDPQLVSSSIHHDYVIVNDSDADYVEIERRKIETETYYRTVDRTTAEDILVGREDGACLVRPFKEPDISIKYIVSIYARNNYFHLFIRQIYGEELYGIGQEKPNEKLFPSPTDIIDFYMENALLCVNKNTSLTLTLKPIVA